MARDPNRPPTGPFTTMDQPDPAASTPPDEVLEPAQPSAPSPRQASGYRLWPTVDAGQAASGEANEEQGPASNDDTPRGALVPVVLERGGVAYATSYDVAAFFGKQHKHVLDSARNLLKSLTGRNLGWFTEATYRDEKGEELPCIEMTRDGLALLTMGFTGPKALAFKVKYIEAFNRMEGQLRLAIENSLREALETEAELRAALASRSGGKVMGFSAEARHVLGGMVKGAVTAQHQAHQLQGQVAEKDRVIQEQAPKVTTLHAIAAAAAGPCEQRRYAPRCAGPGGVCARRHRLREQPRRGGVFREAP